MADRHKKNHSSSLILRELKIKMITRYHLTHMGENGLYQSVHKIIRMEKVLLVLSSGLACIKKGKNFSMK